MRQTKITHTAICCEERYFAHTVLDHIDLLIEHISAYPKDPEFESVIMVNREFYRDFESFDSDVDNYLKDFYLTAFRMYRNTLDKISVKRSTPSYEQESRNLKITFNVSRGNQEHKFILIVVNYYNESGEIIVD